METENPIDVIIKLNNDKNAKIIKSFVEEYISYIELLNLQVFERNGYELVVVKKK